MRKYVLPMFCLLVLAMGEQHGPAQVALLGGNHVTDVPGLITAGLDAYKAKGPEEAIRVWVRNGPLDGDKDAMSQANMLRQVQDWYGAYQSYDVITGRDLTQRVKIIYMVMNFEKGPLFAKFVCYRSDREWTVTNFVLNTKEMVVLPTDVMLTGQ